MIHAAILDHPGRVSRKNEHVSRSRSRALRRSFPF